MQLIPAIDLRGGKVVRLEKGDDARRTVYGDDPDAVLEGFGEAGIELVHVVDLDGAFGEASQRPLVEKLAAREPGSQRPKIELGGGLRDRAAVDWALAAGCERVILGSIVAKDFDAFRSIAEAHPGRVLPAVEVLGEEVRIAGWREAAKISVEDLCQRLRGLPCPAVLVTDVERDGTLVGPNLDLARNVAETSGIPAILSGGVHALDDLEKASRIPEIAAAIVGKALYDGVLTLDEAMRACRGGEA